MKCRSCGHGLEHVFVDLLNAPPSNSYLTTDQLNEPEEYFPLKIFVCDSCWLVQVDEYKKSDDIFNKEYAYFSSVSKSWLQHSQEYVESITDRLALNATSLVVEVASNDGYLLQYFKEKGIPCVGIEPTASTAAVSKSKGIETVEEFFSEEFSQKFVADRGKADLVLGNNVLAHVPDINNFVQGLKTALQSGGTITMEFPHLLNLVRYNQFDTVYHEHFSYLSLKSVSTIFNKQGLTIYDVEELPTHGGSLRIYATHSGESQIPITQAVAKVLADEEDFGLFKLDGYSSFQANTDRVKFQFLEFLLKQKNVGSTVAAYGAAAKGNTLLNYCGVKNDIIEFVVDSAPSKQGKYLPGSHIPIVNEDELKRAQPDYVVLFPWNIRKELTSQLSYIREWGGKFVVAIPELEVF